MHLDTYTFTDIHVLTDTHVFSCVLIRHTHPQVYIHALPHSQMCTLLHTITHIPPYPHSHTLIIISACTHIHTHTHTHIHTHTHTPLLCPEPLNKFKALNVAQPCHEHPCFFPLLLRKRGTYGRPASCIPRPSFLRKMLPSQRAMGEAQDILGGEQP